MFHPRSFLIPLIIILYSQFPSQIHSLCPDSDENLKITLGSNLEGDGYHRSWSTSVRLISKERLVECKIIFEFQIPNGAFLDLETIQVSTKGGAGPLKLNWYTETKFDVEKNLDEEEIGGREVGTAKEKLFYVCSERTIMNSFVFNETFDFPVHMYYGKADGATAYRKIDFEPPRVLMKCSKGIDQECHRGTTRKRRRAPCSCFGKKERKEQIDLCEWMIMNRGNGERIVTVIPVGKLQEKQVVVWGTLVVVGVACLWLVWRNLGCGEEDRKKKRM